MKFEHVHGEVPWGNEGISNGLWEGVLLRDVLERTGTKPSAKHVELIGLDRIVKGGETFGFGGSIPIDKALRDDVLLAWSMNDAPLLPIHGFPLRAIVPGYIGARSVKWLGRIVLRDTESDNCFQSRAYRMFPPHIRATDADWNSVPALGPIGVNSFITRPTPNARVPAGELAVRGIAIGAEGARITRVELSTDDGKTWREAALVGESRPNTWQFWSAQVRLDPGAHRLVVRAFDARGNAQPSDARRIWNFKGYMNNAWDRVDVEAGNH
jgi:sulfite oxidase